MLAEWQSPKDSHARTGRPLLTLLTLSRVGGWWIRRLGKECWWSEGHAIRGHEGLEHKNQEKHINSNTSCGEVGGFCICPFYYYYMYLGVVVQGEQHIHDFTTHLQK